MKVFEMNDCDWYAAETADEAKQAYAELCGVTLEKAIEQSLFDEDPRELTDAEMDKLKFRDDEYTPPMTCTFREQLDAMVAAGAEFPCFFASTES